MKSYIKYFLPVIFFITVSACTSPTGSYVSTAKTDKAYFGKVTKESMHYEGISRNPVIVIHGFQGAQLLNMKSKEKIWGYFDASNIFYFPEEKTRALAFPMKHGKPINKIKDTVEASHMMRKVNITVLGIPLTFPAYEVLIKVLRQTGYQPEGMPFNKGKHFYSLFEFAYDWREDIPSNTERLEKFIEIKRKYIQKKYEKLYGIKDFNVQFDVIAHSMGGLLARYYLQYGTQDLPEDGSMPDLNWSGNKYIDRLIACGTPNAGYLDTFIELLQGGELKPFKPALLGTFPTYYQMLPAPERKSVVYSDNPEEPVDIFNPEIWIKKKWGLVSPEADETLKKLLPEVKTKEMRMKIAKDHLKKCLLRAKQFIAAMAVEAVPPADLQMYLVFGIGFRTSRRAYVNRETGKIEKIDYTTGDGKITATSALWDKSILDINNKSFFLRTSIQWRNMLAIRAAHMGILNSKVFVDNILLLLPMQESPKQKKLLSRVLNNKGKQ
ncbi:MAG: hypothetical protein K9M56_07280 [Victivallales bacterium]|nr:hypothetical protein [Victivallales bacterium]